MCIIAYRPENVTISTEILTEMFKSNPNGAGLTYAENGKLYIKKGFFTLEAFLEACSLVPVSSPCIYHCRIATHGSIRKGTCHPFPLSANAELLNAPSLVLNKGYAIAHNGIISKMDCSNDFSDSQAYVRDILVPLSKVKSLHSPSLSAIIEKTIDNSRLAIMNTKGKTSLFGRGWTVDNGVFYSNTSYKPVTYTRWRWDKDRRAYVSTDGKLLETYDDYDWESYHSIKNTLDTHGWEDGF